MAVCAFLNAAVGPVRADEAILGGAFSSERVSLDQGYRQMYNLQFAEAHRTFAEWQGAHPQDPLGLVSDAAAYLFAEFDRLHVLDSEFFTNDQKLAGMHLAADAAVKRSFDADLAASEPLIESSLARDPKDPHALLADVLRHGLRANYLSLIEKNNGAALRETVASRTVAEKLLAVCPNCYDAYLAIGIENYLLGLKSAPVRWILNVTGAETDRENGLAKLRLTAEKGRYLLPFARLLLAVAALRDKDLDSAQNYLGWLAREFPLNRLYRQELRKIQLPGSGYLHN
jgi:hypothetical protein